MRNSCFKKGNSLQHTNDSITLSALGAPRVFSLGGFPEVVSQPFVD